MVGEKLSIKLLLIFSFLLTFILYPIQSHALDCSSPPTGFGRSWWSSYASWCRSCGGSPDVSTTSCTPGPNWGKSGSSGWGSSSVPESRFDLEEQWRQQEQERILREKAERRRKLKEIEQELNRRQEKALERDWEEKERIQKSFKGDYSDGELGLKDSKKVEPFSIDVDVSVPETPNALERAISTTWKQHYCGRWITGFSFPAAQRGDATEVKYLGKQALMAFNGGAPELQCPSTIEPLPVGFGKAVIDSKLELKRFYKVLNMAVEEQAKTIESTSKELTLLRVKKRDTEAKRIELEEKVETLKKEMGKLLGSKSFETEKEKTNELKEETFPDGQEPESEELAAAEDAMAAALAALEAAKEAEAEVDEDLSNAESQKIGALEALDEYQNMFNSVKEDPSLATKYLEKFTSKHGVKNQ